MNNYYKGGVMEMYIDYNMGDIHFSQDNKLVRDLLDIYLNNSHGDFFEDKTIVENKIPEFNFVK